MLAQIGEPSDSTFGVRVIVTESPQVGANPKEDDGPLEQITDTALSGWYEDDNNPVQLNALDHGLVTLGSRVLY